VGGQAGAPPDHLATPAQMKIDYIHAYTLNDLPSQAAALTSYSASSTQHHLATANEHSA